MICSRARTTRTCARAGRIGAIGLLWNALRELLHKHRSVPNARWRLPDDRLGVIDEIFCRFVPEDLIARYVWLFSNRPALPEGHEGYHKHGRLVEERRVDAARVWYPALGASWLIELSTRIDRPDALGQAVALTGALSLGAEEAAFVRAALEHEAPARASAAAPTSRRESELVSLGSILCLVEV